MQNVHHKPGSLPDPDIFAIHNAPTSPISSPISSQSSKSVPASPVGSKGTTTMFELSEMSGHQFNNMLPEQQHQLVGSSSTSGLRRLSKHSSASKTSGTSQARDLQQQNRAMELKMSGNSSSGGTPVATSSSSNQLHQPQLLSSTSGINYNSSSNKPSSHYQPAAIFAPLYYFLLSSDYFSVIRLLFTVLYCAVHTIMHIVRILLLNIALNSPGDSSAMFLLIVTNNFVCLANIMSRSGKLELVMLVLQAFL